MSELISTFLETSVLPHLRCSGCSEFFKGDSVHGCAAGHATCSLCWEEGGRSAVCKAEGCDKTIAAQGQSRNLGALVRGLGLAVPCQNRGAGCGERAAGGDAVGEHEDECGYRKVSCGWVECGDLLFKDLSAHLQRHHHDSSGGWELDDVTEHDTSKFATASKLVTQGAQLFLVKLVRSSVADGRRRSRRRTRGNCSPCAAGRRRTRLWSPTRGLMLEGAKNTKDDKELAAKTLKDDGEFEVGRSLRPFEEELGNVVLHEGEVKINSEQIQNSVERAIDAERERIVSKGSMVRNTTGKLAEAVMRELPGADKKAVGSEIDLQLSVLLSDTDPENWLTTPAAAAPTSTTATTQTTAAATKTTTTTTINQKNVEEDKLDNRYNDAVCAYVTAIGGRRAADKYRAEIKMASKRVSLAHSGPAFPVDEHRPWRKDDCFKIALSQFRYFNNHEEFFGDHNRDENGKIDLPVTVTIEHVEPSIDDNDNDDDEDSFVVIDEDYGDLDDVYEDAVEDPEEPDNGEEGLEWDYDYGLEISGGDKITPRHASCGYATCDSDEEDDYEKVAFEKVDSIPLF